ncbi:MAG TPA: hypothetical protein VKV26_25765 [Dehalococcoidia bacterium]|nr:hypothetical protein [Dehalococcoidia bacterium]
MTPEPVAISRRQGYGCLAIAAVGLLGAALCIVLGIRCLATDDLFNCIGLLTVFPAAFAAVGLVSLAVGVRRFTTADASAAAPRQISFGAGWQRVEPARPDGARRNGDGVIELPGRSDGAEYSGDGDEGVDEQR